MSRRDYYSTVHDIKSEDYYIFGPAHVLLVKTRLFLLVFRAVLQLVIWRCCPFNPRFSGHI